MNEYKKQLVELSRTPEIYKKITIIGDKYNLMLDSQDELTAETQDVIRGYKLAKDFVKNIKNRLEITQDKAEEITKDINTEVFESIKDKLQQIQSTTESIVPVSTPTPIEQVGRFTIDKPPIGMNSSTQYKETNINKEAILQKIEDPVVPIEKPMVDHLLTTPVTTTTTQVEVKRGPDPYREQI